MRIRLQGLIPYIPNDVLYCRAMEKTQRWETCLRSIRSRMYFILLDKNWCPEEKKQRRWSVLAHTLLSYTVLHFPPATTHPVPPICIICVSRLGLIPRGRIRGHCTLYNSSEVGSSFIVLQDLWPYFSFLNPVQFWVVGSHMYNDTASCNLSSMHHL